MLIFMLIDFHILPPTSNGRRGYAEGEGWRSWRRAARDADYPRYQSWWIFLWREVAKSSELLRSFKCPRLDQRMARRLFEIEFRTVANVFAFTVIDFRLLLPDANREWDKRADKNGFHERASEFVR